AAGRGRRRAAGPAPHRRWGAAQYDAGCWVSLLRVPEKGEFPGTGDSGNGMSSNIKSRAEWVRIVKSGGCLACHQLGTKGTREIPADLGHFESSAAAWQRRIQSGQAGAQMLGTVSQLGLKRALAMFADWTD